MPTVLGDDPGLMVRHRRPAVAIRIRQAAAAVAAADTVGAEPTTPGTL
ncbi:hypothetical protein ACW2Q0_07865 [Nocardia sp. R16R-3T]